MNRKAAVSALGIVLGVAGIRELGGRGIALAQPRSTTQPATKPDDHESAKFDLGTQKIGGFDIQVGQVAEAKAGEEAIFIITIKGGTGKPRSIRAWIGIESGQGSIRTAAEEEKPGEWHAHHPVSKPMPASSKLWVEVETAAGRSRASYSFK